MTTESQVREAFVRVDRELKASWPSVSIMEAMERHLLPLFKENPMSQERCTCSAHGVDYLGCPIHKWNKSAPSLQPPEPVSEAARRAADACFALVSYKGWHKEAAAIIQTAISAQTASLQEELRLEQARTPETLRARERKLREALVRHGRHLSRCGQDTTGEWKPVCTCGLETALTESSQ